MTSSVYRQSSDRLAGPLWPAAGDESVQEVGINTSSWPASDLLPGLSSRHRLVVTLLLDLAGYLSADAHRQETETSPFTGKRDGACLFRRALALANRPCLEAVRAGLIRLRDEARAERQILRAEVVAEFLEEVELRLSLFRDMMIGSPAD